MNLVPEVPYVAWVLLFAALYSARRQNFGGHQCRGYNRSTFSPPAVFRGTSIAVLTYIGFDSISTLSDEAHDPARTIQRAILLTCLITGLLASIAVYLAQLVWPRGAAFPDLDTAYVAVAQRAGGTFLFDLMNGPLLIATIGSGMASQLGVARLLFAMGQDGALPRRFFGTLNPVRRIPQNNVCRFVTHNLPSRVSTIRM
jgi:putrescine importer